MEELEDKLSGILNNPQLMQQIMSVAQTLGGTSEPQSPKESAAAQEPAPNPLANIDLGMLQKLSGLAGQNTIDREQQALLSALGPYLSRERVGKLERAMRAARMARMASAFLNQGGLSLLTGR